MPDLNEHQAKLSRKSAFVEDTAPASMDALASAMAERRAEGKAKRKRLHEITTEVAALLKEQATILDALDL